SETVARDMTRSIVVMDTIVTITVVRPPSDDASQRQVDDCDRAIARAFEWFRAVETCCTRFDPSSELMQLTRQVGAAVEASAMLFEAVRFALAIAKETGGAFDPTVGAGMEARGF